MFSLTNEGVLRRETTCLDVANSVKFVGKENNVQLAECPIARYQTQFEHTKVILIIIFI